MIEGTATFVQSRYRQRYLDDQVPLAQRLEGMRGVIAAAPGVYAVNAEAIFDYVDGGLFVRSLFRRVRGWRLVDRALDDPPESNQLLPSPTLARVGGGDRIRLGLGPSLSADWRPIGGGRAGEEQALVILLAGTISSEAVAGAAGWDGGRFAVWRSRSSSACVDECASGDLGVIALRWRRAEDAEQFSLAVPAYMIAGRFASASTSAPGRSATAMPPSPRQIAVRRSPSRRPPP